MSGEKSINIPDSFEERIERLEKIVGDLEEGDAPLEESLNLFEEGIALAKACQGQLEAARERVTVLLESAEGDVINTEPVPEEE
ncbi:exodeoxyribonuclease VII small subunit [Candidatus Zixiibacteriota bacterium]